MLVYYESAVQGKGAWGGGSLSGHKDYIQGRPQDLAGGGGQEFFFSDLEICMSRS